MMVERMKEWKGKWALVTGASSGMGVEYARRLAETGVNLVITARRTELLEKLALELHTAYGARVETETCDLSAAGAATALMGILGSRGIEIDILINNAGYGLYGTFIDIDWSKEKAMLELDIVSLVELTRLAAAGMKKRGWGRILQVASLGAYQPLPFYSSYAAAKAFVLNYGIAIGQELAGSGVTVTVLSPGFTKTEFFEAAGHEAAGFAAFLMMSPERAVRVGLDALARGTRSVTPGVMNKLIAFSTRFPSRAFAARLAGSYTGAAWPFGD